MAGRSTGRVSGMQLFMRLHREDLSPYIRPPETGWRVALLVCSMIASLVAGPPVFADEFDPLAVYAEARTLNDQWQACAASFIRERIHSRQDPEILANEAFERCQAGEDKAEQLPGCESRENRSEQRDGAAAREVPNGSACRHHGTAYTPLEHQVQKWNPQFADADLQLRTMAKPAPLPA